MPPLIQVAIPRPPATPGSSSRRHGPPTLTPHSKSRSYPKGPLPIKPSDFAPAHAIISARIIDDNGAKYTVSIGDVQINDVGIEEILDYVSAQHLEEYETKQFEEENELIKIAEAEQERLDWEADQRRARRRRLQAVDRDVLSSDDDNRKEDGFHLAASAVANSEAIVGRHGRARPTYKHLFLAPDATGRRRRKRDKVTGELLPLSDDDTGIVPQRLDDLSSADEDAARDLNDLSKRRRRKRDKITGALLPLSPVQTRQSPIEDDIASKRPRRRRHPITGELMPLGWRYNEDEDEGRAAMSPAMQSLSLHQDAQSHKRRKIEKLSSVASSPGKVVIPRVSVPRQDTSESRSETSDDLADASGVLVRFQASSSMARPGGTSEHKAATTMLSPARPPVRASPRPKPVNSMTAPIHVSDTSSDTSRHDRSKPAVTHSWARRPGLAQLPGSSTEQSSDEESMDEGEFIIEAISAHAMSDPRTHPVEMGHKPVMMYKVKWKGYEEPTWEPASSFDLDVVNEYRQRHGLSMLMNNK